MDIISFYFYFLFSCLSVHISYLVYPLSRRVIKGENQFEIRFMFPLFVKIKIKIEKKKNMKETYSMNYLLYEGESFKY